MVQLESDLAQALLAAFRGELDRISLEWSPWSDLIVMIAGEGYPGSYIKGTVIKNVEEAEAAAPCVKVFHAGTAVDSAGNYIAVRGRVLGVTAKGKDIEKARDGAYQAVGVIDWPEGFFRKDICWRALLQRQSAN